MNFSVHLEVVFLVQIMVICSWTSIADPRTHVASLSCSSTVAVSGAVLADNFVAAMNNVSSLVNRKGFGTVVVGESPNAVYALAQCFGDLNATDCTLCFSEIRSILPTCYPRTGGRIFFDGCFGRYENHSFFSDGLDSKDSKNCSVSSSFEPDAYREALRGGVGRVSSEAQKHSKRFAVGTVSVTNSTVYALAQCWEDSDTKTCKACLQAAASTVISCSPAAEGRSLNAGCYIRYSNRIFWNTYSHSSGKNKVLWIMLAFTLLGFLLLTGTGIWKWKEHLCDSKFESFKDAYGVALPAAISNSKINFRYQDLRKATDNFNMMNKLGQGSYGAVFKAVFPDGKEVAVKRLFLNARLWVDQFINEVGLISQLHHKNLVKLLGCSVDGPESLFVYEYYYNRSLDHFIFEEKLLDWKKRINIILGVAEGLHYLHEESEIRIIHRDIKASNILLDDSFKPKITDFGLARSFTQDQTHLSTGVAGTIGYMAPEYVVHGHLTEKADVYSFGVLLLEIVTGQRCHSATNSKAGDSFLSKIWSDYKAKTVKRTVDERIYEDALENEFLRIVYVGLLCTQAAASYRPTMAKVLELLKSNIDQGDVLPTEPPFLDILVRESQDGETQHMLSGTSAPSFSESSGSLYLGR